MALSGHWTYVFGRFRELVPCQCNEFSAVELIFALKHHEWYLAIKSAESPDRSRSATVGGTALLSLLLNKERRRFAKSALRFTAKPILRSTSFNIFMMGSRIRFLASASALRILFQFSLMSRSSQKSNGCWGLSPAVERTSASMVTVFPSLRCVRSGKVEDIAHPGSSARIPPLRAP